MITGAVAFVLEVLSTIIGRLAATSIGRRLRPIFGAVYYWAYKQIRRRQPKSLSKKQIERVLIVRTKDADYAQSFSKLIESELSNALASRGKILLTKEVAVGHRSHKSKENVGRISDAVSKFGPRLLISIGTASTLCSLRAVDVRSNASPAIVFTGLANPVESGVVDTLGPKDLRGRLTGLIYDIAPRKKIEFLSEILAARKVAFITDEKTPPDAIVFEKISNGLKEVGSNVLIDLVPASKILATKHSKLLENYDYATGWLYMHQNLGKISARSPIPIIGGGAIDARNGAFVTIGDDETEMAKILSKEIVAPYLVGEKSLTDAKIYSAVDLDPLYEPKIYVNLSNSKGYELDTEKLKQVGAIVYSG